jgi:uncharacterized coiled-coil protein SlyX
MIQRQTARSPGTRTTRNDPRQRRLESLSAEFALLAQRRARVTHQIDLLDEQRAAAATTFAKLQARMGWLVQRMDAIDPGLRALPPEPEPEPEPAPKPQPYLPAIARFTAKKSAPAEPPPPPSAGRQRAAIHAAPPARPAIRKWRI